MSWDNIYYSPEKFGVTTIGEVEFSSGCYEFDTFVVWQNVTTKEFYWAQDSGCSCPTPFDNYSLENVNRVASLQDLLNAIEEAKHESCYYQDDSERIDGKAGELVSRVMEASRA